MAEIDTLSIAIIKGSVRPGNYTGMAAALVAEELSRQPGVVVEMVDPAELGLALPGMPAQGDGAVRLRETVARAAGVVLATPEYHGSFSSVMKLVIENLGFRSVSSLHKVFDTEVRVLDPEVERRILIASTYLTYYLRGHVCPAIQLERLLRGDAA